MSAQTVRSGDAPMLPGPPDPTIDSRSTLRQRAEQWIAVRLERRIASALARMPARHLALLGPGQTSHPQRACKQPETSR